MVRIFAIGERVLAILRLSVACMVGLSFAYMFVVVLLQVFGRYVFNFSIGWAAETATFAQVWAIFLAAGLAMRDRMHVGIDMFFELLPTPLKRTVTVFTIVLVVTFIVMATWGSIGLIRVGMLQTSPILQIPMSIPYLAIPVGMIYFALEFVVVFARKVVNPEEVVLADETA